MKSRSLYNKGMKVSIYSQQCNNKKDIGWFRGGDDITYYRNGLYKLIKGTTRYLSTVSFTYTAEYNDDIIYFANSIPYTYTQLCKELNEFEKNEKKFE